MSTQTTIGPVMHTFPGSPVRPAYEAPAILHGRNWYPVCKYQGRDCYVTGSQRIRRNVKGWGYFTSLSVHFLDGTIEQIPAAKFAKASS